MQEEVRNVVLSYLRAHDVRFVWRDGFVEIPDARAISRLASGRPSLSLTFDREAAALLKNVDYVTFGHPLLDQILEELRGQAAYVERFFGIDLASLFADGIPYLTWEELAPGSVTPVVSRPSVQLEHLLLVRLQLDIESDFRHVETFGVLVDLGSGCVVPERAIVAQRSALGLPDGFTPPVPAVAFEQAIAVACNHARVAGDQLIDFKRHEAEGRLATELRTAESGGLSHEQIHHLERELGRKYNVKATFRVVGVERWFIHSQVHFTVRVPAWEGGDFTIRYDVEKRTTHVELTGGTGTQERTTHVRLCAERHGDAITSPLIACAECGKRFCNVHVSPCSASGAPCCDHDLERCADANHRGRLARRLLRLVSGRHLCEQHIGRCDDCGKERWTAQLEACAISQAPVCFACRVTCQDCSISLSPSRAIKCERSGEPLCPRHAVPCVEPGCGKTVRASAVVVIDRAKFCPEHVGQCSADHPALKRRLSKCSISGAVLCTRHVDLCTCGRTVSTELLAHSPASGKNVCPTCRVRCAECKQFFLESETKACALSGRFVCAKDLVVCAEPGCGKGVSISHLVALDEGKFCPEHVGKCARKHPALVRRLSECAISGAVLCHRHTGTCTCGRVVSKELFTPSAASGAPVCPACRVACVECKQFFLEAETEQCALSGGGVCRDDLLTCESAGCGRRFATSLAFTFRERRVCPSHLRLCPDGETHETLEDLVTPCTLESSGCLCSHNVCETDSHRCGQCSRLMCRMHTRHAVEHGPGTSALCPPCLEQLPHCQGCGAPVSKWPCPLCVDVSRQAFRSGLELPQVLEELCRDAKVPTSGPWRVGVHNDASVWERRVGLRIERWVLIENDPVVYRGGAGAFKAFFSMFSGS